MNEMLLSLEEIDQKSTVSNACRMMLAVCFLHISRRFPVNNQTIMRNEISLKQHSPFNQH